MHTLSYVVQMERTLSFYKYMQLSHFFYLHRPSWSASASSMAVSPAKKSSQLNGRVSSQKANKQISRHMLELGPEAVKRAKQIRKSKMAGGYLKPTFSRLLWNTIQPGRPLVVKNGEVVELHFFNYPRPSSSASASSIAVSPAKNPTSKYPGFGWRWARGRS